MTNALESYCKFYNAIPWGGYKVLVIDVLAAAGTHTCGTGDTIDMSPYFSVIDGAIGFNSGNAVSCTWSTTTLTTVTASLNCILIIGH